MSVSDHTEPAPQGQDGAEPLPDRLADLPIPPAVDFSQSDESGWRRLVGSLRRVLGARKAS